MRIKSFKGRRLLAELSIEVLGEKSNIDENTIKKIEAMEAEIKALDTFLDSLPDEN
jgi:hypothetical protein